MIFKAFFKVKLLTYFKSSYILRQVLKTFEGMNRILSKEMSFLSYLTFHFFFFFAYRQIEHI